MAFTKEHVEIRDGDQCKVVKGTHAGKAGTVRDTHVSRSGVLTITVIQANGERFKTLGRNIEITERTGGLSSRGLSRMRNP